MPGYPANTPRRRYPYENALGWVWSISLLDWIPGQQAILNAGTVTVDLTGTGLAKDSTLTNKFTAQFDYSGGSNLIYFGQAATGSATSSAVWQIRKFTYDGSSNLATMKFANGSISYNSIWDDRASLSYT